MPTGAATANRAEPATLTCNSPPGSGCSQGVRPRNRWSDRRVRNNISPIQMKSGKAVKVQLELADQITVAMASPTGRSVNRNMFWTKS